MAEIYRFRTFGPFQLARVAGRVSSAAFGALWEQVEGKQQGLSDAQGVYLIAVQSETGLLPWYVGKTEVSFKQRFDQHWKLLSRLGDSVPGGNLEIVFIARVTSKNLRLKKTRATNSIDRLEDLLIGACIKLNPALENEKKRSLIAGLIVPGYNFTEENETDGPKYLRKLLSEGTAP